MPVCQEKRPKILVIGSINMDMVARIDHIPLPGETVLGQGYSFAPGGKGANAAVAAARKARFTESRAAVQGGTITYIFRME